MALSARTYGTVERTKDRIAEIFEGRSPSPATVPSVAEIERALDDIASEIHMALAEAGYAVETSATLNTDAPRVLEWLRHANSVGAALLVLESMPAEAVTPEDEQGVQTRAQRLFSRYKRLMAMIPGRALEQFGLTKARKLTQGLYVGSHLDSDGNTKLPLFKRGMTSFVGTRDLTEE